MGKQTGKIVIVGSGGMGRAVGLLLARAGIAAKISFGDKEARTAKDAVDFVCRGLNRDVNAHAFTSPPGEVTSSMKVILADADVVLDCTPGDVAPHIARCAHTYGIHYANLTEYVEETRQVRAIAEGAQMAFVMQCGLAPGYINIAAHELFLRACRMWQVSRVKKVLMRVGALTETASPPSFYGWTWSPDGVATEYLESSVVIRNGKRIELPALSDRGRRIIQGIVYEEALTSGGAADLPEALEDRVDDSDYMTLRWPGHYAYVERALAEIPVGVDRVHRLREVMERDVPHVEEDVVVFYAAVEGFDHLGRHRRLERSAHIRPLQVGGVRLRAIQATTAASLAEVTRIMLQGRLRGPVTQSQIPTEEFLNGSIVSSVYGPFDRPASLNTLRSRQAPIPSIST